MAALPEIERVGREIGNRFNPERVLLFGSHARGNATPDSDVDLLVIMPENGRPVEQSVQIIRLMVRPPFPVDILVRSPESVRERIAMGDDFMPDVIEKGVVLYESSP